MTTVATTPGLSLTLVPRPTPQSPLRSDVAGFIGRTKRGPVGKAVRVEGWRGYLREFGGLTKEWDTPWTIRGYFENGGQVAYVVRLLESPMTDSSSPIAATTSVPAAAVATATWMVGPFDKNTREWQSGAPIKGGFRAAQYRFDATSPGTWANGTRVSIRYRRQGVAQKPEADLTIYAPDEPIEYLVGVHPKEIENKVNSSSILIRLSPDPTVPEPKEVPKDALPGPQHLNWDTLMLSGGADPFPQEIRRTKYLEAIQLLGDEPEVALMALPDLHSDLSNEEDVKEILEALLQQAAQLHDRLVLIDLPKEKQSANCALQWVREQPPQGDAALLRSGVVYHPYLRIPNPLGGVAEPLRNIPPSGHIAGVISRLDRERGAHHTPANTPVLEAVDVTTSFEASEQAQCNEEGINLLRCFPGRGLQVWGGRTLDHQQEGRFIAHRRLIHRLVRAIRRVAEPLVFDINGPELWLTFVRTITTVLLEAWRAGALKGDKPDEAFRVRCDEKLNPSEERDQGRVLCEIEVATAAPMEFILLRVALGSDGTLEVFES